MSCTWDVDENVARAEALVRSAADRGAQLILLQELFETPYFCLEQDPKHFALASRAEDSRVVQHFSMVARELGVVLPISYFEQAGPAFFNAMAVLDVDGSVAGHYRKSHIPQNPGYEEKFYFSPGDQGFSVVETGIGRIGCAVCWDQWFPETARVLALKGAEILIYPTAIGSEPAAPHLDSAAHWRRVMQGHSAANLMPVIASNRIGTEAGDTTGITFYGSSFITDGTGEIIADADRTSETAITASLDLDEVARYRAEWCVFRDRRPDLYGAILTLDGK
jgi:N-carbamoylputrescine amidase